MPADILALGRLSQIDSKWCISPIKSSNGSIGKNKGYPWHDSVMSAVRQKISGQSDLEAVALVI